MKDFDEIFDSLDRSLDRGMETLDKGMSDLDKAMSTLDRKLKNMKTNKNKTTKSRTQITINGVDIKDTSDVEKLIKRKNAMAFHYSFNVIFSLVKWTIILVVMYIGFSFFMYALKTDQSKPAPLNPSTQQEQTTNEFKKL